MAGRSRAARSGAIAGETFARVKVPPRVVILGPNHHGIGHRAAVFAAGSWVTPLGETAVDGESSSSSSPTTRSSGDVDTEELRSFGEMRADGTRNVLATFVASRR